MESISIVIGSKNKRFMEELRMLLSAFCPAWSLAGAFQAVSELKMAFRAGTSPDLMLLDTDLSDGKSFDLFTECYQHTPVIFFSESERDAIHAFKTNSVDFLLKEAVRRDPHGPAVRAITPAGHSVPARPELVEGSLSKGGPAIKTTS